MSGGWRIGEIGGVAVRLNASLIVIAVLVTVTLAGRVFPTGAPGNPPLLYWLTGLFAAGLFIGSVLWHEMAHALFAIRYRIPVLEIELHLFGGVAKIARDPERPAHEFVIALAGPASSLVLAAVFGFLTLLDGLPGVMCGWLSVINLTLAIFNLLPGFPLDGGRVLRAALWHFGGSYRRATRQASRIGQGMAALFAAFGLFLMVVGTLFNGLWFLLIAAFLYSTASMSYRMSLGGLTQAAPVHKVMRYNVPQIDPRLPLALLAWRYLDHARDQAFPVYENQQLIGLVTAAEAERIPRLEWGKTRVGEVMIPRERIVTVRPEDDLAAALSLLDKANQDHAPVLDGSGRLVGMLNRRDIVHKT